MSVLATALAEFRAAKAKFTPTRAHLVPDLALLGLLCDVEENAEAVLALGATPVPHRAYPNARAAFEASQQALLLATEPDYDLSGARAWAFFLRNDREFVRGPRDGQTSTVMGLDPDSWFKAATEEMAETWETFAPGKGDVMKRAVALVEAQPRRPDNFAGVPIAPTLRDRLVALAAKAGKAGMPDAAALYNNAYAALSRESHPRTQLRPEDIRSGPDDTVRVRFEERDLAYRYGSAELLAAGALRQALAALGARSSLAAA